MLIHQNPIYIFGASNLGSAIAMRLFRTGFHPVLIERQSPVDIHYNRTFNGSAFSGKKTIDGISAKTISGSINDGDIEADIAVKILSHFKLITALFPICIMKRLKSRLI